MTMKKCLMLVRSMQRHRWWADRSKQPRFRNVEVFSIHMLVWCVEILASLPAHVLTTTWSTLWNVHISSVDRTYVCDRYVSYDYLAGAAYPVWRFTMMPTPCCMPHTTRREGHSPHHPRRREYCQQDWVIWTSSPAESRDNHTTNHTD